MMYIDSWIVVCLLFKMGAAFFYWQIYYALLKKDCERVTCIHVIVSKIIVDFSILLWVYWKYTNCVVVLENYQTVWHVFIYCNVFLNILYFHIAHCTFHAVGRCLRMNAIFTKRTTMSCQVVVFPKDNANSSIIQPKG